MRMTHSTAAERAETAVATRRARGRGFELVGLLAASLVAVAGLWLVYSAQRSALADAAPALTAGRLVNLNEVDRSEQLLPLLETVLADAGERRFVADRLASWLNTPDGTGSPRRQIQGVNALGTIALTETDLKSSRRLLSFRDRLAERRAQLAAVVAPTPAQPDVKISLLTPAQLAALRRALVVRTPASYRGQLWLAIALFFPGFYLAHAWLRLRRSAADPVLLPIVHVLCGIGFVMMVGMRDPLRDAAFYARFAQGTLVGCLVLAAAAAFSFQRSLLRKLSYVPLLGAVALSLLLIAFGSGPGSSDAKVNLMGVQPVEAIRVLVVLFLAGYFANRWELLRALKEPKLGAAGRLGLDVPRFDYVLPVLIGMGLVLLFFFLQKDLGPALVLACVFLAMYGVARGRVTMVAIGLLLLAAGFACGYALGYPHTVVQRIQMWLSPWDNPVRGGDQIAHALWALGTGAATGTGLGLGDPHVIPAGHTDLILAAVGEELGLVGLAVVFVLNGVLAYRSLRIALRAPGDYTCFLALGLTLGIFLQLLLISAGLLGLMPLTGVATPFLSYGRSSMIANFLAFGILLSISAGSAVHDDKPEFARPVWWVAGAMAAVLIAVVVRVGFLQTFAADRTVAATALTVQADGVRRFEYNPRLLAAAQQIVRGTITDRNGIPLATSRVADLQAHATELTALGIAPTDVCPATTSRCYPFGGVTFHLLGDWRSQVNWAAGNTSFIERDSDARLRGYNDHARVVDVTDSRTGKVTKVIRRDLTELLPLLRHRYQPQDETVQRLLTRPRDIRLAIDIRLQLQVASILKAGVDRAGQKEGAAVVLTPDGDLLASVSYPWPSVSPGLAVKPANDTTTTDPDERLLDRARYGLYPPGSAFKVVTATAALRKDTALTHQAFTCERLPDGRVGKQLPGWNRPIRDDPADKTPHGTTEMERGLIVSCNAYFAQLGLQLGAPALQETAGLFEISLGQPESAKQVRDTLPFAAYGQGQVLATPFKMARVAATIAADGAMPQGRWIVDETNRRTDAPRPVLTAPLAQGLGHTMRRVVLEGTGRSLKDLQPPIAGKTGTAEVQDAGAHAWFIGFAPFGGPASIPVAVPATSAAPPATAAPATAPPRTFSRIAFAVLVEHGGHGGTAAAPIAGNIVTAAKKLEVIR
ncbi:MAG TPA: FtsW/RodA/SpoVE family cell cycle protein [Vicinamibacterales bacterium]|jgi:cell division protein FtsW (lipid II flippase)